MVYENESSLRIYRLMKQKFSDETGYLTYPEPKEDSPPPKGWEYAERWHVDLTWDEFRGEGEGERGERERVVDELGWQYADNPYAKQWYPNKSFSRTCKRRRWICRLKPL